MGLQCVRKKCADSHPHSWRDPVAKTDGSPQVSVVWAPRDLVREYPPMFVVDHPACVGANPGVHQDAAIHVTPTPGSAGALAGMVSHDVSQ